MPSRDAALPYWALQPSPHLLWLRRGAVYTDTSRHLWLMLDPRASSSGKFLVRSWLTRTRPPRWGAAIRKRIDLVAVAPNPGKDHLL